MSNSAVANIYDKQPQLIAKQMKYPHLDLSKLIKLAKGIIRFEIQVMYPKIYDMINEIRRTSGRPLNNLDIARIMLSDEMAKNVLYGYFARIIGLGDYYTLPKAKTKIEKECCSTKAARLIAVLEFVNKCRGIHKAKAKLDDDVKAARESEDMDALSTAMMKVSNFVYSLRELNVMGINPVTIPREDGVPFIPNLLKVFDEKTESKKFAVIQELSKEYGVF